MKNITGSSGLTIKRSRFENVGRAIYTDWSGSKDYYIADNVMIGRFNPNYLMGFTGRTWQNLPEFNPKLVSEYAVKVYGSGHVVAYNSIANFHDGVDVATYGNPDGSPKPIRDRLPVSIDFYGNDISNVEDNCIESDGGAHNIRIFRNRCFNHGHRALSVQPMFGGPVYFIRNIVYHAPEGGAVKFTASSSGIVMLAQHAHRSGEADAARSVERALPEQSDPRKERDARNVRRRDQYQLLELRLQRLPAERRRRVLIRMELAGALAARRTSLANRAS